MYPTHHPCPTWLHDKLCHSRSAVHVWRPDGPSDLVPPRMIEAGDQLDLTHLATRAAVLQACADHVASPSWMGGRAWALGAPWSALDQEQAARACSAILTALAEGKPGPNRCAGPWMKMFDGGVAQQWGRRTIAGAVRPAPICFIAADLTAETDRLLNEANALFHPEHDLLVGVHL